jgi:ABC-type dipeptide/oligopeptide/nickel transport system ATPase subunit
MIDTSGPVLRVEGVNHGYGRGRDATTVLKDVSFQVAKGQTLAVIGESGAGKSTLTRILAGLEKPSSGSVSVGGQTVRVRTGRVSPVQVIFQQPSEALNRFAPIGRSIAEPLRHISRAQRRERVFSLLERVGIDPGRADEKPSAFSGGQLQRVVTARALAASPSVLLCDEPTSALDVSVQAQIVNLLLGLQADEGLTMVLVTHDLGVAKAMADDVLVLRLGEIVEHTNAGQFFRGPVATYSRELLQATSHQLLGGGAAASGETSLRVDPASDVSQGKDGQGSSTWA